MAGALVLVLIVYPSDTVLVRLGIVSLEALTGLHTYDMHYHRRRRKYKTEILFHLLVVNKPCELRWLRKKRLTLNFETTNKSNTKLPKKNTTFSLVYKYLVINNIVKNYRNIATYYMYKIISIRI